MHASYTFVSPRFFTAVGTRVLQGRTFTDEDTATSRHVAVVNQTFVKKYLNGKQPIGILFGPDPRISTAHEIVGVVDDSKYGDPSRETRPMFFMPLSQTTDYQHVDAPQDSPRSGHEERAVRALRFETSSSATTVTPPSPPPQCVASSSRSTPTSRSATSPLTMSRSAATSPARQLVVRLTAIFGALALILASIGLYGVTAYGVARRIPEIGLRMALGADRASVVRLILRGAATQIGIGLLIGIPAALLAGHFLQSQLYQVNGYDFRTILAACGVLLFSALVASAIPARRASSVEPMQALRAE